MTPTDALIEDAGELGASRAGILQDARMTRPDAATEALAPTSLAAVRAAVEGGTEAWGQWASAERHIVYVEPASRAMRRRKCCCGCGRRITHHMAANGIALAWGCEFSAHQHAARVRKARKSG